MNMTQVICFLLIVVMHGVPIWLLFSQSEMPRSFCFLLTGALLITLVFNLWPTIKAVSRQASQK